MGGCGDVEVTGGLPDRGSIARWALRCRQHAADVFIQSSVAQKNRNELRQRPDLFRQVHESVSQPHAGSRANRVALRRIERLRVQGGRELEVTHAMLNGQPLDFPHQRRTAPSPGARGMHDASTPLGSLNDESADARRCAVQLRDEPDLRRRIMVLSLEEIKGTFARCGTGNGYRRASDSATDHKNGSISRRWNGSQRRALIGDGTPSPRSSLDRAGA